MKKTPTQRRKLLQKKLKVRPKTKKGNNLSKVVVVKNEPLLKSTELKMQSPVFNYNKDGSLVMTHIELIDTITSAKSTSGTNGFNIVGYHVNAGIKSSFPFLHALAQNYKTYEFSNLSYSYIARGNYSKDGAVMFHAEYDPSVSPPENRIEFLNRSNAVEAQVFKNITYSLKNKDMKKEYTHYVRIGPLNDDQDVKLYDVANIWFGYEGTSPSTILGDIFVTYTVKLSTPTVRLAEKQIKSIESNIGTTPIANSATVEKPFGDLNPGSFVGDFLGSLLDTATGGLSGLFFTTAKTVLKTISMFLPNNQTPLLAGPVSNHAISIAVPKGNSYIYKSDEKMVLAEGDSDILQSADRKSVV